MEISSWVYQSVRVVGGGPQVEFDYREEVCVIGYVVVVVVERTLSIHTKAIEQMRR